MEMETLARLAGPVAVVLLLLLAVRLAVAEEPRPPAGHRSPSDPRA